MIKVFYTIALRIFFRDPQFLVFTVCGLAVSFVVSFILWQHATYELKSDSFHPGAERIVRTGLVMRWTDDQSSWEEVLLGINAPGLVKAVANKYDEIEDYTRIFHQSNFNTELIADHGKQVVLSSADKSFAETKVVYADSNLFSFFHISLLKGNPSDVLKDSNAIVLSERIALKYFGDSSPVGKTIRLNNSIPLTVTGVFENLPHNTHLTFDIVISSKRLKEIYDDKPQISVGGPHCYYKLKRGVDHGGFIQKVNTESTDLFRKAMYEDRYRTLELFFQPLSEISFSFHRLDQHNPKSKYLLKIVKTAAWVILVIGLVNYINLMISSHGFRLKELAVKKTSGASFRDFCMQFIFESALVHGIALVVAIVIMILIKTPAERLLDFYIPRWNDLSTSVFVTTISVFLSLVLLTGLYPTLIFFKIRAGRLFKLARVYNSDSNLIKILSVLQYGIAIVMLILVFTISHQLYFVMNQGQGIRKDNAVVIDLSLATLTPEKINDFTRKLKQEPLVEAYTFCHSIPGDNAYVLAGLKRKETDPPVVFESNGAVDPNYIPFFNLEMVGGQNFKSDSAQKNAVILSEGAAERLGFKPATEALGGTLFGDQNEQRKVVGIVREYKLRPLLRSSDHLFYENTGVVLNYLDPHNATNYPKKLAIRYSDYGAGIRNTQSIFESVFPHSSFIVNSIDTLINSQYYNYQMSRNQLVFFLVVTMLIALMGLYAMTSLKIVTKTKEIGVRKALGASLWNIIWFLLNKSVSQIGVAALIALPGAYFILQQYFNDFEEHIQMSWYHFLIPLLVFFTISWVPIASIVIKTAKENPAESLKYE
jgi:putative ABC transport system permease protein